MERLKKKISTVYEFETNLFNNLRGYLQVNNEKNTFLFQIFKKEINARIVKFYQ